MGWLGAIVGGILGAVATYFTWDPEYVYYGWTIGAAAGSALEESNRTIRVQGPKLADLTIQTSTYGGMVPIHFGTVGVTGIPIDLDVITPHEKSTSSSGKGGPTTVSTTTTYTTSTAILLGEGVCDGIKKAWIDGKLVYTNSGAEADSDISSLIAGNMFTGNFKFYPGTETQLPDPTLEAIHGVGNVPAYRGVAYVVFTDNAEILNGNSLRQLKFELVYSGNTSIVNRKWTKGPASAGNGGIAPQAFIPSNNDEFLYMRPLPYTPIDAGLLYAAAYEIWSITPTTQMVVRQFQVPDQAFVYGPASGSADEVGHLMPWITPNNVFQGMYRWILPDDFVPDVLDKTFEGSFYNFITGVDFVAFNPANVFVYSKQAQHMLLLGAHAATPGSLVLVKLFKIDAPEDIASGIGVNIGSLDAERDFTSVLASGETISAVVLASTCAWVISFNGTANTNILRKCSLADLSTLAAITYAAGAAIPGGTGEVYGSLVTGLTQFCLVDEVFYMRSPNPSLVGNHYILRVDNSGVITVEGSDGSGLTPPSPEKRIGADSEAAQVDISGSGFGFNPSSGIATFMANENVSPDFAIWPYSVSLRALSSGETTVAHAVSTISKRVGYTDEQIDVDQIPDPLPGYSIASIAPGRSAIEPLLKFAYADSVDSDGKTKYVKRGGAPVFTVWFDDLCAHEDGAQMPEPFPLVRTQEVDLPSKVIVNFKNPLADYETGSAPSPQRSTTSKNPVVDELAIVMSPQKAAEIASVLYFDQIIQRQPRSFTVLKKFDFVEPTDPGWVEYPRGTFNPVRIVKREENGPILKFECVPEDADSYTPKATASEIFTGQAGIDLLAPSTLTALDIPILQDADDNAGIYMAMAGSSKKGTSLFRSPDNLEYGALGYVEGSATTGWATSKLGDWMGPNGFDEANSVDVWTNDVLNSATAAAVIDDQTVNAFALGLQGAMEVCQFKVATLLSPGKYRLSGLLRGRRGTEWATGLHTAKDVFALLAPAGMMRPNEGAGAIGAPRYYKPVTPGRTLAQTYSQMVVNTAVGLRPFSPVNLTWGVNAGGDYLISAQRRSRLQERQGIFWDLPLGEVTEAYRIKIYSDPGYTTLKRTIEATGFPITYTAAMQTADFGALATSFYLKLYQLSATVGEGYPLEYAVSNIPFRGSWNPDDAYNVGSLTFANANSTALYSNASSVHSAVRAGQSARTGKRYFEIVIDSIGTASNGTYVGICNAATVLKADLSSGLNVGAKVLTWFSGSAGQLYGDGTFIGNFKSPTFGFTTGDVIGFYVDFAAGKAWIYKNGVSLQGDPVAGTSELYTFTAGTAMYPFFNPQNPSNNQQASLRLALSSFTNTLLSGYSAFIP